MIDISREDLERVYITEGKTRKEAADYFGVKPYVISNYALKYGLKKESQEEILARTLKAYPKEKVEELYRDHKQPEMCVLLGNITPDILNAVLKYYNLGKRQIFKKAKDTVSEEDIVKVYLEQNNTFAKTVEILGISGPSLRRLLNLYNIVKSKDLIQKNIESTVLEKYSVDNVRKSEYFKEISKTIKQEKYGDPNYNNRDKAQDTNLEKYGVYHHNQDSQISSQIRQHRWFDKSSEELQEIQKKTEATNLERYGVIHPILSATLNPKDSKPNLAFAKNLEEIGIQFVREYVIENRSYDFKVGNKLIEIDPFATHNSTWGIKGGSGKDVHYHRKKSQLAKEHGFQCIHVFDWDDRSKIIKLLQPRTNLYARKLKIQKISQTEANILLRENHLQGPARMQTACYGLFLSKDLVEVMTFGKPRFNKNYEWELIRLCTKAGYCVIGGAERLFKAFLEEYNPNSIISYCDSSKFTGNVYIRLRFTLKADSAVSRHWYNPENKIHITDNGLRMRGFDRLLGDFYGRFGKGTSNDELMRSHGFVEIYDAGQAVYVWNK